MSLNIKKLVDENKDFLISIRRQIHEHPELGSNEFETNKLFRKYLDEWGIPYKQAGKTSIVATIKGGLPGKTIATRGDIDALPIQEETGLPFASKNAGIMHACGHDIHGTYQLGLAKILKDLKSEIKGTVKIIFQEGEEIGAGAHEILDAGLLDDVDTIVGLHVASTEEVGKFTLNYGIMSAIGGGVVITISSEETNALIAAAELATSISAVLNQKHSKKQQTVAVPTVVKVLEKKGNIPSKVQIHVNFRGYEVPVLKKVHEVFDDFAAGIEKIHSAKIDVEHSYFEDAVNNDKKSTDRIAKTIERTFGKGSVVWDKPSTGGENFSVFQQKIPGVFVHVGAAPKNHPKGEYKSLHSPNVVLDEQAISDGVELFLNYIFDYLEEKAA